MCGYLEFLFWKIQLFYSVNYFFNWTPNWCANLSCVFYAVQAHLLEERPWHHQQMSCNDSLMTYPTTKRTTLKMHHWKIMPEQITINSPVDSSTKGRRFSRWLLIANQFLKSWTKLIVDCINSGSDLVECARGDAEAILPKGMPELSAFPVV